ncbi:MAG TPA: phosphatase PAP2 family protein [Burkholderiales bacterium]|jgi:undecaprenyl-diphosphatase|nr:phosphatase PAP2 family protein [Burkholderiales bacterium]
MQNFPKPAPSHQWLQLDERLSLQLSCAARIHCLRTLFRALSGLGDGVFWYALMLALLATDGTAAIAPVLHMVAAGLAGTMLYRWLKATISRPRPYQVNEAITCNARPLDQFSFPSGHTLHAVAFSTIAIAYYPQLAFLLISFAFLVTLSRMVLGLHYPSDVLAGAAIGAAIASISFVR